MHVGNLYVGNLGLSQCLMVPEALLGVIIEHRDRSSYQVPLGVTQETNKNKYIFTLTSAYVILL